MHAAPFRALCVCAAASLLAISACASNDVGPSRIGASQAAAAAQPSSYEQTLRQCRKLQPGRLNKRLNLPPDNLRVAACLRKRGWQPDGTPHGDRAP